MVGKEEASILCLERRGRIAAETLLLEHALVLAKDHGMKIGNFAVGNGIEFPSLDAHEAAIAAEPQGAEVVGMILRNHVVDEAMARW